MCLKLDEEEIEVLAFRLYKKDQSYEQCIHRLAELCKIIELNIKTPEGGKWCDLNAFETVEDLKRNLKDHKLVYPTEEQIKPLAKRLAEHKPTKSKLHWYIAEKMLIFKIIKKWLEEAAFKTTEE